MLIKKRAAVLFAGASILLSACGEQELPEEVYKTSMENMAELENVYFTASHNLNAAQEGVSTFTRGVIDYGDPLEAYMESNMSPIDVREPIELDMRINGDEMQVREKEEWTEQDIDPKELDPIIRPKKDLSFFLDFEEEFLMKENEELGHYEVSFKGTDERHHALVEKKLGQLGITEASGGISEEELNSIQLDRIEMVAFIEKDSYLLLGYDTRYTFTIELAGQLRSFHETSSVRYDEHNQVEGDLETFMEEKVKEIEQKQMEEQEEQEEQEESQEE